MLGRLMGSAKNLKPEPEIAIFNRGEKSARDHMLAGLCKVASQMDDQLLPPAFRRQIFSAVSGHAPDISPYLAVLGDQVTANASTAELSSWQAEQIERWVRDNPEFLFSLLIGLASGRGEDFAWALAYA